MVAAILVLLLGGLIAFLCAVVYFINVPVEKSSDNQTEQEELA